MALANELSSEIAVAILSTSSKSSRERQALQEVIFRVHSILNELDNLERTDRRRDGTVPEKRMRAGTS